MPLLHEKQASHQTPSCCKQPADLLSPGWLALLVVCCCCCLQYLVNDRLLARCGAQIRIEVIDRATGRLCDADLSALVMEVSHGQPRLPQAEGKGAQPLGKARLQLVTNQRLTLLKHGVLQRRA